MRYDYARFGVSGEILQANARRLDDSFSAGLRPPPRMGVAEWAVLHRKFPEGTEYEGGWRHETAPYLVEIMDCLSPHHPAREVAIKKCAQSGGSASAENWIGYVADVAPGMMMYVQANLRGATDWARDKLWPMIRATPKLGAPRTGAIAPRAKSDADGSTLYKIKFRRGEAGLLLAGSNSAATLSGHTIRYAIEDDLDRHEDNVEGQGSSESMVTARLRVATRTGRAKRLKISTPTIAGASKINVAWLKSDQRRFYFACPGCGDRFDPAFEDLRWPDGKPREAQLVAPCCGSVIGHGQKEEMSRPDGWLATCEVEGIKPPRHLPEIEFQVWRARDVGDRQPGFWISGIVSSFLLWADLCEGFVDAQGDLNKLKGWTNLDLGEVFEVKGSTPDYDKLKALKEQDWARGQVPRGALVTTMGVDVQGDGLYFERLGWGPNAENWSIDVGFIPGPTDVPMEGAWKDLDRLARQELTFAGGKSFPLDQVVVDAGYHTAATEAFCRAHPNRLPVFGRAGWRLPVLGRGENLVFERQGQRSGQATKRAEDKAYQVGTFGVKLTFYGYLRSTIKAAADEIATGVASSPQGRCHFNRDAPDDWFEQITAETIVVRDVNGYPHKEWKPLPGRPNHYLDCRVYNHAGAEKLMLDTLTETDWAALRADRESAPAPFQGDLLSLAARPAPSAPPSPAPPPADTPASATRIDHWIAPVEEGWLG